MKDGHQYWSATRFLKMETIVSKSATLLIYLISSFAHNAHTVSCLKYIIASCRMTVTGCNVDSHANNFALFLTVLYPVLVCNMFCTVKLC